MGDARYIVVEHAGGWTVCEDETVVADAPSKEEALMKARVLAYAVKAVGGQARVFVQDRAGCLEVYNLDGA